ncbi:MAG TPA: zinc ribbon domain-containing protein [Thermoplasmata archaeon]|nr:zinc ribbon domain-containing protein [Thermoplasmata archaeon]
MSPTRALATTLIASLLLSPAQLTQGGTLSIQTSASGGTPPYGFVYQGLPNGCPSENLSSFQCNPSESGSFAVSVSVTDSASARSTSPVQTLVVTLGNNGNNNHQNGAGNNSSNPFSSLFSGVGNLISLLFVVGIVAFITWILLIVGVWVIAIVLLRRLPKGGASSPAPSTVPCGHCSAVIPAGSKFCSECGAATGPKAS